MKRGRTTMEDIARLAGVSTATVSRVLRNQPRVKEETRRRVWAVVQDQGYRPNAVAQGLATGQMDTVGLVVADIRNPFDAELARGVEDACFQGGMRVVLASTDGDPERERLNLEMMQAHRFAGIILTAVSVGSHLRDMHLSCPVVLVNRYLRDVDADCVLVDNRQGGYAATRYLLSLGHRRIAHLAGPLSSSASRERLEGYRLALREWGVGEEGEHVVVGDLKFETGYQLAPELLQDREVTAVFAANDLMAVGVMEWAMEHGLSVPEDLSVVGYDDTLLARMRRIGLTTVRQPQYDMGRTGAELLLRRIRGQGGPIQRVLFRPELVVRSSCARPAAENPARGSSHAVR